MHGMLEAQHTHGHHLNHTRTPARGPSGTDGPLIKQQPERNYRCQLIEKFALFIEVRRLCPLIKPHYPRRTRYSPVLRSVSDGCVSGSYLIFSALTAPQNLEIHKVFLRFSGLSDQKISAYLLLPIRLKSPNYFDN